MTRFFTKLSPAVFLSIFTATLKRLEIPHQVIGTTPEPYIARVKISTLDKRRELIEGSVTLQPSQLDAEGDDATMSVDGDGQGKVDGWDVVMWKKKADPLELKRLWQRIVQELPAECVYAL